MKQSRVVVPQVQGNSKWRNVFISFCLEMHQVSAIYREPHSYFNVGVKPENFLTHISLDQTS